MKTLRFLFSLVALLLCIDLQIGLAAAAAAAAAAAGEDDPTAPADAKFFLRAKSNNEESEQTPAKALPAAASKRQFTEGDMVPRLLQDFESELEELGFGVMLDSTPAPDDHCPQLCAGASRALVRSCQWGVIDGRWSCSERRFGDENDCVWTVGEWSCRGCNVKETGERCCNICDEITPFPTPEPTPAPTLPPTPEPTPLPTPEPTPAPINPTENPTPEPTAEPTPDPTSAPINPTGNPTPEPTTEPEPTPEPTPSPTLCPQICSASRALVRSCQWDNGRFLCNERRFQDATICSWKMGAWRCIGCTLKDTGERCCTTCDEVTPSPTAMPTPGPTELPTPAPLAPTPDPTPDPSSAPVFPTPMPTSAPAPAPTPSPVPGTPNPTLDPTAAPINPTAVPTPSPTPGPSPNPTVEPEELEYVCNNEECDDPLLRCQGDCDEDGDCDGDLECFQRNGGEEVPGCIGGGDDDSLTDYCYDPNNGPTPPPTSAPITPTPNPTPAPVGSGPTPSPTPAPVSPPSPSPTPDPTPAPTPDPTPEPTPAPVGSGPTVNNQLDPICNDDTCSYPLNRCQGDCDSNSHCLGALRCFQRSAGEEVPGCVGGADDDSSYDYCYDPRDGPTPAPVPITGPSFRLKLYYEDGYCWQGDCFDPQWCAFYNYNRDFCYYNNLDFGACVPDRLYIDKCGDAFGDDQFRFLDVGDDRVMIVAADEPGSKCLERRDERRIYVADCVPGKADQEWFAPQGSFGSFRFEISIDGVRCMTQVHHPKEREVLDLLDCEEERRADTTFWERD